MIEVPTEPAPVRTEHDTEPMAVVRPDSPEKCGVCGQPAQPYIYCHACHTPLCKFCMRLALTGRGVVTACSEHEKGDE